ncbi:unnamed protein product, partial [Ectocarpus fasciculatus]
RIQKIAEDPVASADFFHITIDAVMKCLLRFGAKDGDGGVLGRVKAYVGMTEEQKRLTLHCHLLVWCHGYQDFSSLRDTMDKTPDSYHELASFLSRTIFCQVASEADVQHAFRGDEEPTGTERDHVPPAEDPLERPATECIPVPPPSACYPPPRIERNVVAENEYFRHFQPDVANVTRKANTHACTFTCHKFGHANSCRYFDRDAEEVSRGKRDFKTVADRFTANLRREQPMVNTYNAIIQYCIRSNMDIKVLLRDSDARGALFYILNYSTKTETNVDAILNLLAPVVER